VFLPAVKYPNYGLDRATQIGHGGAIAAGSFDREAQAEMTTIARGWRCVSGHESESRALVVSLKEIVGARFAANRAALAGAVAFVLLIDARMWRDCFASRMMARERERAVRQALARQIQLISHVLGEAVVLAILEAS